MPALEGMLKTLTRYDKISGSFQLARAIWALGRLGKPSTPAEIARTIRARTALNWEGPQAAKFFRRVFEGAPPSRIYFTRHGAPKGGPVRTRYFYDLTADGRDLFKRRWVEGDWKPRGTPEPRSDIPALVKHVAPFRQKDINNPTRLLEKLRVENLALKEECGIMRDLLNRIHSCHHGEVEKTMSDIDTFLGGVKGSGS